MLFIAVRCFTVQSVNYIYEWILLLCVSGRVSAHAEHAIINVKRALSMRKIFCLRILSLHKIANISLNFQNKQFYVYILFFSPSIAWPDSVINKRSKKSPIWASIFLTLHEWIFSCEGKVDGMYADVEARCQVWHQCFGDRRNGNLLFVKEQCPGMLIDFRN